MQAVVTLRPRALFSLDAGRTDRIRLEVVSPDSTSSRCIRMARAHSKTVSEPSGSLAVDGPPMCIWLPQCTLRHSVRSLARTVRRRPRGTCGAANAPGVAERLPSDHGRGAGGKVCVFGILKRGGRVRIARLAGASIKRYAHGTFNRAVPSRRRHHCVRVHRKPVPCL